MITTVAAALVAACTPTFNWRDVREDAIGLGAQFPCKPDRVSRPVEIAGVARTMRGTGCDAGGATFTLLWTDLGAAGRPAEVIEQWRRASLGALGAPDRAPDAFAVPGATPVAGAGLVAVRGTAGGGIDSQAVYFARDGHAIQAAVQGAAVPKAEAATFFSSLAFR